MKYEQDNFVNLFALRQYGPFVREARAKDTSNSDEESVRRSCEPYYQSLIEFARRYIKSSSVCLDIGCGPGRLVGEFSRLGARHSIGTDMSSKMTFIAKNILTASRSSAIDIHCNFGSMNRRTFELDGWGLKGVSLFRSSAEALPLMDGQADLICCANVLTRLPDPTKALSEIRRVLKPGAVFLVSNDYDWSSEYTRQDRWFANMRDQLDQHHWMVSSEIDLVPYTAWLHARKCVTAFNHVMVAIRL